MRVEGARAACWRARARACSTRAKHITPGPPVKRHRLHTRVFQARNPNQKCFAKREARMTRGKSHFDAAPPPSPFIYISQIAFKKSAILWDYRERLSRPGGRGEEERKKKTKKIIIKMSHRESPMSRKSERKKRERKKKFGNIIKIRWKPPVHHPFPTRRPVFHTSSSSSEVHLSRLSWSNSPYTNIHFDRIQRA